MESYLITRYIHTSKIIISIYNLYNLNSSVSSNDKHSNVRILAFLESKDEKRQELKDFLVSLLSSARKEEGNMSYDLYSSNENPNEFLIDELWTNEESFNKHYESSKSQKDRETVRDLLNEPLKIKKYFVINGINE